MNALKTFKTTHSTSRRRFFLHSSHGVRKTRKQISLHRINASSMSATACFGTPRPGRLGRNSECERQRTLFDHACCFGPAALTSMPAPDATLTPCHNERLRGHSESPGHSVCRPTGHSHPPPLHSSRAYSLPPKSSQTPKRNAFDPCHFRHCASHVVTEGIDLNALIGREFEIQGVRFAGVEECRPCYWMNRAFGTPQAEAWLKGNGGLRARILTDGMLRCEVT